MKDWKFMERAAYRAKTEKEKRKAYFTIRKHIEKSSSSELKQIIEATGDVFIREQAKIQLWWQAFDKKPENLLKLIRTSNNKNKITNAIIELGNLKCKDAASTLISFLEDIELRDSAALALRQIPTQEAFVPLIKAIKQHPDGAECLLYALQVIDCSDAAKFLVELFISNPYAPVVRDDIFVCFAKKAVKHIPKKVKDECCSKVFKAAKKSQVQSDVKELKQFYEVLSQTEDA